MNGKTVKIELGGLLPTLLFVLFLVLKLTDCIDWPWIWVFAPLWIPILLALGILILFGVGYLIFKAIISRR